MDPKLPSNPTAMLMQAQERKNLVNKLINLKSHVDTSLPKNFNHMGAGRINQRNKEVRKINTENQNMLKKIMSIMHRKPKGNGLEGVSLKRQGSQDEFTASNGQQLMSDSFQGNADIKLIQSNVDNNAVFNTNNRFSFEIVPGANLVRNSGPFKHSSQTRQQLGSSQRQKEEGGYQTQPLGSPAEQTDNIQIQENNPADESIDQNIQSPELPHLDAKGERIISKSLEEESKIGVPAINENDQKAQPEVHSSVMFDNKLPTSDSDANILFQSTYKNPSIVGAHQVTQDTANSYLSVGAQQIDALTTQEKSFLKANGGVAGVPMLGTGQGKKLFPAQITLNHTMRKQEVKRINRENLIMMNKLRDVKPAVGSCIDQVKRAMKFEEYKRNMSKFKRAGQSQPRPRLGPMNNSAFDALPSINRSQSKQQELNAFQQEIQPHGIGHRRTSQGQRTYLEAQRQMKIPGSQCQGFRKQRNNFAYQSNEPQSEYQNHQIESVRQSSLASEQAIDQMTAPDSSILPAHNTSQFHGVENTTGSIVSAEMQTTRQGRRPSYLQKLKKSPLMSSMTKQQNIPKSIVNRVVTSRDEQTRTNFRKFGMVTRAYNQSTVDRLFPDRNQNSINTQSSVISQPGQQRNLISSSRQGGFIGDKQNNQAKALMIANRRKHNISPMKSKDVIKVQYKNVVENDIDTHALPTSEEGFSMETPQNFAALKNPKVSIPPISEEYSVSAMPIQIEDQQKQANAVNKPDISEEDQYTQYTPISIDVSQNNPSISHVKLDQSQHGTIQSEDKHIANAMTPINAPQTAKADATTRKATVNVDKKPSAVSVTNAIQPIEEQSYALGLDSPSDVLNNTSNEQQNFKSVPPSDQSLQISNVSIKDEFKAKKAASREGIAEPVKQETIELDDEAYTIPQESRDHSVGYSQEDFEDETFNNKSSKDNVALEDKNSMKDESSIVIENQTNLFSNEAIRQEDQTSTPALKKQSSEEIVEEKLSNADESQQQQFSSAQQNSDKITENIQAEQPQYSSNSMNMLSNQDKESDQKTVSQSKSALAKNYGIQAKNSESAFMQKAKIQVSRVPTNTQVTRSGLIDSEKVNEINELNTCGTGFYTEKVSRANGSGEIIECKENIILSELSSKKNLE